MFAGVAMSLPATAQSRMQTDVLNPWDTAQPSMGSSMSSMGMRARPRPDPNLGSLTRFPTTVIAHGDVLDPWVPNETTARERELMRAARRVRRALSRCERNRRALVRYRVQLSPLRVRGGVDADCVLRALRQVRFRGSGNYELVLNFTNERPAGVYVVDRSARRRRPNTQPSQPSQPRQACNIPGQAANPPRRTGTDDHFPDFFRMRVEAVRTHHHGPIAEAACEGLGIEVLDPWSPANQRGTPTQFDLSWVRRVRQRTALVLECIPAADRPPSWALSFLVEPDGRVRALYDADPSMASCIAQRISAPPQRYQLHVNFGESPAQLYVDSASFLRSSAR